MYFSISSLCVCYSPLIKTRLPSSPAYCLGDFLSASFAQVVNLAGKILKANNKPNPANVNVANAIQVLVS